MENKDKLKIIFMGTPEFSLPSLKRLNEKENVVLVVTKEDKPQGRGLSSKPSPVKVLSKELGVPVYEPKTLKDESVVEKISSYDPDVIVVVAYGKFLPDSILKLPRFDCINIHPSLLPKYRGAAPMNWALINGEKETGVSSMYMAKEMDAGDILLQKKIKIDEEDNLESIHDKLAELSAEVIDETIQKLKEEKLTPIKQDPCLVTFARILKKEDGKIDWDKDGRFIFNQIRGMNPWPGTYSYLDNKMVKILKTELVELDSEKAKSGARIIIENNEELVVKTGKEALKILSLQLEGKKKLDVKEFLKGFKGEIKFANEKN